MGVWMCGYECVCGGQGLVPDLPRECVRICGVGTDMDVGVWVYVVLRCSLGFGEGVGVG